MLSWGVVEPLEAEDCLPNSQKWFVLIELIVSTSNRCHASSNKCLTSSNKRAIRII